jgi:hypothetical protein
MHRILDPLTDQLTVVRAPLSNLRKASLTSCPTVTMHGTFQRTKGILQDHVKCMMLLERWKGMRSSKSNKKQGFKIERGKYRHKYCRRKLVWDYIERHVRCGYTPNSMWSYPSGVWIWSRIIDCFKRDEQHEGIQIYNASFPLAKIL